MTRNPGHIPDKVGTIPDNFDTTPENLALFRTKLALFQTTLALFQTKLALFRTKLALFRTRLGLFRTKLAPFQTSYTLDWSCSRQCKYLSGIVPRFLVIFRTMKKFVRNSAKILGHIQDNQFSKETMSGTVPAMSGIVPALSGIVPSLSGIVPAMSRIWPGFLVTFQTMQIFVRNMTRILGHVPDNEIWCPEYDQKFWHYSRHWHYSGQY